MGNTRDTQYSRDAQAQAKELAAPSRSLSTKTVVLAAVLALIAAVAFVGAMGRNANAYIPDTSIGNGNDGKPTVTAEMKKPSKYSDVDSNQRFRYEGTVTFSNVKPGTKGEYTFTVRADSKAPFEEVPGTGSISDVSSNVDVSVVSANKRVVTYKLTPNTNFSDNKITISFSASGKLSPTPAGNNKARIVRGSVDGSFKPVSETDVVAWTGGNDSPAGPKGKRFNKDVTSCTGTAEFAYKFPAGGYLMDIKWADAKGVGGIEYGKEVTIEYYAPSSNVASALPESGTYIRHDPTPPYYGALDPTVAENPNARWIDSHNWRFNPATSTGSLWLPAGSGIKVSRTVTLNSCTAGAATGPNFNPVRDNEILNVVEIGNNIVPVSGGAVSSFVTPGVFDSPGTCTDLWTIESGTFNANSAEPAHRIGFIDGLPSAPVAHPVGDYVNQSGVKQFSDGAAISSHEKLAGRLYLQTENGLSYAQINKPGAPVVDINITNGNQINTLAGALAFDKNGVLYAIEEHEKDWGWRTLYKMELAAGNKTWIPVKRIKVKEGPKDLAFTSDGSLLVLSYGGKKNYISRVPSLEMKKTADFDATGDQYSKLITAEGKDLTSAQYGMAFDKNGVLVLGQNAWNYMYSLNASNGKAKQLPILTTESMQEDPVRPWKNHGDLASCNFDDSTDDKPKERFKVEKSAVDPVTGEVLEPGNKSPNPVKISNGLATVNYVISVANLGTDRATPPVVKDSLNIPGGMEVESVQLDGTEIFNDDANPKLAKVEDSKLKFDITSDELAGQSSKSYYLQVRFKVTNLNAVSYSNNKCEKDDANRAFYNKVDMEGDEDTSDNWGCIPVDVKKSRLRLVKTLSDRSGDLADQTDAEVFQLTAGATRSSSDVVGFTGAPTKIDNSSDEKGAAYPANSGTSKNYEVVPAGAYKLAEGIVSGKEEAAEKYAPYAAWKCVHDAGSSDANGNQIPAGTPLRVNNDAVGLVNNNYVTCTVKNAPTQAYIIKRPFDSSNEGVAAGNPHWGKGASVTEDGLVQDRSGNGYIAYTLSVRANTPENTRVVAENIRDQFTPPKGLVWNTDKNVIIEARNGYVDSSTELYLDGKVYSPAKYRKEYTSAQMEAGVVLADKITRLRGGQPPAGQGNANNNTYNFEFKIRLPLKIDTRRTSANGELEDNGPSTRFNDHLDELKTCSAGERDGKKFVNKRNAQNDGQGIVNVVTMDNEDTHYSSIWEEDNVACIPLDVETKWSVAKRAKSSGGAGWAQVGDPVTPTEDSNGKWIVNPQYRVTVTNNGRIPDKQPAVKDTLRLNGGFNVRSVKLYRAEFDASGEVTKKSAEIPVTTTVAGIGVDFTIPATSDVIAKGTSVEYLVDVVGERDEPLDGTSFEEVDECRVDGGLTYTKGLFNRVKIPGKPDENESDDDACVPVTNTEQITIKKFDSGNNPLAGAEFVIYPDNGDSNNPGPDTSSSVEVNALEGNASQFTSGKLTPGKKYWLKETKAPSGGHELLPQPLLFKVVDGKIQIFSDGTAQPTEGKATADGGSFVVDYSTAGDPLTVNVHDPRAMELPKSGGMGRWPIVGVGVLLFMLSMLYMMKTSGVSRRRD